MKIKSFLVVIFLFISAPLSADNGHPYNCEYFGGLIEAGENRANRLSKFAKECVRLNQVQVLGTHNSYHIEPAYSLDLLLQIFSPDPPLSMIWSYTHAPLEVQLSDQGIRQLEIDVFLDRTPTGDLYVNPVGDKIIDLFGFEDDPPSDPDNKRSQSVFQVMHVQDVDFRSTCITLFDCLITIQEWSWSRPEHLPIMILLELKDEDLINIEDLPSFTKPSKYSKQDLDDLDALIRSIFPNRQLITPDDIRGDRDTLEEAVLYDGWPTLKNSQGRVMFALDNDNHIRNKYLEDHPSLIDRVMFVDSEKGQAEAAFMKRNDPISQIEYIKELVELGYIVRTRADSDTIEARYGLTTRRGMALESGAQFISTDYPIPDPDFVLPDQTFYHVQIPEGIPARCNPVNFVPGCRNVGLEDLNHRRRKK